MNSAILKNKIRLENERVLLLPFEDARHQELKDIIFDDAIWKFMGMFVQTEADFDAYVKNTLDEKQKGNCYPFLIIDKTNDKIAGSSRYGYLNLPSEKCEIGWTWYGTAFQGTGLNKACKYELLHFGFEQIGFRRIQ
ncbi:MAG: GNAT family N-acetyltransferase, partial [Bacteroidota bacterium]